MRQRRAARTELLRKKGIEVLLLSDRIDEWMMNYLTEFDGKPFQSVSKVDESLEKLADEVDESAKEAEKALTPFIDRVKALLGERVKDVRLTHRLTDTPAIVSTDADEMSTQMAKLFAAAGQKVPEVKYIFELNPDHVLVKRAADTEDEAKFSEWVELLLDQALLAERGTLEDPNLFIRRMNQLAGFLMSCRMTFVSSGIFLSSSALSANYLAINRFSLRCLS